MEKPPLQSQDPSGSNGNGSNGGNSVESISAFMGNLKPGTPGPGGQHIGPSRKYRGFGSPIRKGSPGNLSRKTVAGFGGIVSRPKRLFSTILMAFLADQRLKLPTKKFLNLRLWYSSGIPTIPSQPFGLTELVEGDSSRKIVEIICRTSWSKPENSSNGIERILKVHNMQKVLAHFRNMGNW
ncbi:hypothetical protein HAX54_004730 [Datura stramonium]|uniref:Uncharacterized protein n=1 Tax=Datura stramonium TaxID=4076 RepID=A0ABS8T884_DATST|nr:hypothetical protein [Datura stramonium]